MPEEGFSFDALLATKRVEVVESVDVGGLAKALQWMQQRLAAVPSAAALAEMQGRLASIEQRNKALEGENATLRAETAALRDAVQGNTQSLQDLAAASATAPTDRDRDAASADALAALAARLDALEAKSAAPAPPTPTPAPAAAEVASVVNTAIDSLEQRLGRLEGLVAAMPDAHHDRATAEATAVPTDRSRPSSAPRSSSSGHPTPPEHQTSSPDAAGVQALSTRVDGLQGEVAQLRQLVKSTLASGEDKPKPAATQPSGSAPSSSPLINSAAGVSSVDLSAMELRLAEQMQAGLAVKADRSELEQLRMAPPLLPSIIPQPTTVLDSGSESGGSAEDARDSQTRANDDSDASATSAATLARLVDHSNAQASMLAGLQQQLGACQSGLAAVDGELGPLRTQMQTVQSQATANASALSTLQQALDDAVAPLTRRIDALASRQDLGKLQGVVDAMKLELALLRAAPGTDAGSGAGAGSDADAGSNAGAGSDAGKTARVSSSGPDLSSLLTTVQGLVQGRASQEAVSALETQTAALADTVAALQRERAQAPPPVVSTPASQDALDALSRQVDDLRRQTLALRQAPLPAAPSLASAASCGADDSAVHARLAAMEQMLGDVEALVRGREMPDIEDDTGAQGTRAEETKAGPGGSAGTAVPAAPPKTTDCGFSQAQFERLSKEVAAVKRRVAQVARQQQTAAAGAAAVAGADAGLRRGQHDHALLSSRPLTGYKCMACDRPLDRLEESPAPSLPHASFHPYHNHMSAAASTWSVPEAPGRTRPLGAHVRHGASPVPPEPAPGIELPRERVGPTVGPGGYRPQTSLKVGGSAASPASGGGSRFPAI